MSSEYPRSRDQGRYSRLPYHEKLSSSRFGSSPSSWRDGAKYDDGFYEIGGRYGHIPEYQTYAKQRESGLITALFSESSPIRFSSGAIQLVLGIREEGTQHLLIPVTHYEKLCVSHSQGLPQLNRIRPYRPQEFATLSPIAFRAPVGHGECELSKKLKSITKTKKKKHLRISPAEARERIDYERSRTLLRILREETLFFEVKTRDLCFVVLYTNNTTVGPAKDIVFGTVHADQLRDRNTLTEQITAQEIEHVRIAGRDLFHTKNELKDLPGSTRSLPGNQCLPRLKNYLNLLRKKTAGEIVVLVDDWNEVLEVLLPPGDVPNRSPGDPHPFALLEGSKLEGLRWQRGIAPLLSYSSPTPTATGGGKYESSNRPMKSQDLDLNMDYGNSRNRDNSTHNLNGATRRRSLSPAPAPDFYVVETRRMYKTVRGSGNLPESARDGCNAFGLDIPDSGTGLDELKLIWSLWVKMAGGLSMDEERARNWQKTVTLAVPEDEDENENENEETQRQEEVPAEPESLEAMFSSSAVAPTHQPVAVVKRVTGRVTRKAFLDSESDEDYF